MKQSRRLQILSTLVVLFLFLGGVTLLAWTSLPVESDPLLRMPGTQPGQVTTLERPNRCLNCHSGYDEAVEPGSNWMGSMMAQSARDFLFWACMTVAGQDSVWALENPNAVDLCERCHFPKGWLEGRSDPPNASEMSGADFDGVQCDFCHNLYDPFFEGTHNLAREGDLDGSGTIDADEWQQYWDETNLGDPTSQAAAAATYAEDAALAGDITLFNGDPFFGADNLPVSPNYTENGGGQYFVSPNGEKRSSFSDANGRHDMLYSRYNKSKYFCNTCHDVSNPALANLGQDGSAPLTSETEPAYSYFHIERTFSEFMLSDFGLEGGSSGIGPYAPALFTTSHTGNAIATCQDCHMPDAQGAAAHLSNAVVRPGGSVEHPQSGQPVHDLTGGNAWVGYVLASAVPGSPNYDPLNEALLDQGPSALTLDLGEGDGFDPEAILRGVDRAQQQLLQAAAIEDLAYDPLSGAITFRVQNHTGHKLISGFPEGRRMFVGIKAYAGGVLIHEVNPYDATVGTLKGLPADYSPNSPALAAGESHVDELVYEMHPSSSLTGEQETFHFALADGRYKDNRIPPKGFRIDEADDRLSQPVWQGAPAPTYFTDQEYAGGYDAVDLTDYGIYIPGADSVEVALYYQTTSREYIEFLRGEINGTATTLPETAYIIQSDPFFGQLKAWGETIWQLWYQNRDLPGAAPFQMATASWGAVPQPELEFTTSEQTVGEGVGSVLVTVELSETSDQEVSAPFTVGGTATGGGVDHNLANGTFTIEAGSLTDSVTFQVTSDSLYERSETIIVTLGAPLNATLDSEDEQTITITDDDSPPTISFSNPTYTQDEDGVSATITVTLSGETALDAAVQYASSDGSADAGADYTAVSGPLAFAPGVVTQTFVVPILDDDLAEGDETVILSLTDAVSATLGTDSAELSIVDDEGEPTLSISDASTGESDGTLVFTVTLSLASASDVSTDYATNDGPAGPGGATAGADFTGESGTLDIPAGSTQEQINVTILQDDLYEGDELFTVELSNPGNATIGDGQATGTIVDDDNPPEIGFESANYDVSEAGGSASITVTLSGATQLTATVDYATSDDTATDGADYTAVNGILIFPPGTTQRSFSIPILDDGGDEFDETVNLALTNPTNATLATGSAVCTIVDDEGEPTLSISDASAGENDGAMVFTVTLSFASASDVSTDYATSDGPAGPGGATAGADYTGKSGTLDIPAGSTQEQIGVTILQDDLYEGSEVFTIDLSNPANASLTDAQGQGTIIEDEQPPEISIGDLSIAEAGATMLFPVSLSTPSDLDTEVSYATSDGAGLSGAIAGADYVAASGALAIPAGASSASISVDALDDAIYEPDEIFHVTLSDPVNATLGDPEAIGTLQDNDDPPQIEFDTALYVVYENAGTALLNVTLSGPTALTATVNYATADGPPPAGAEAGQDYVQSSDTITFSPGETNRAIAITILDDALPEADETFAVTLSGPAHSTIGSQNPAIVQIKDGNAYWVYLPCIGRNTTMALPLLAILR
jgi:hypothetical protein